MELVKGDHEPLRQEREKMRPKYRKINVFVHKGTIVGLYGAQYWTGVGWEMKGEPERIA